MWPGIEPVDRLSCRDLNLLASAAISPYGGGFGIEYYPTLESKAAYIFFHIATSHIFQNGNKRTAVLTLDQFLAANSVYLMVSNSTMEKLAEETASYNQRGESKDQTLQHLTETIAKESVPYSNIRRASERHYRSLLRLRKLIRADRRNQQGVIPLQALRAGVLMRHEM